MKSASACWSGKSGILAAHHHQDLGVHLVEHGLRRVVRERVVARNARA